MVTRCGAPMSVRCAHVDTHTALGGCMHRRPSGGICGCTWTPGPKKVSPFDTMPADFVVISSPALSIEKEHTNIMTEQLMNIAGVAAELSVTPQLASSWHRGPEQTPEPSFKTNTGLELWTVEDIESWHRWVEAKNDAEQKARDEKAAKKAAKSATEESEPASRPAKNRSAA